MTSLTEERDGRIFYTACVQFVFTLSPLPIHWTFVRRPGDEVERLPWILRLPVWRLAVHEFPDDRRTWAEVQRDGRT